VLKGRPFDLILDLAVPKDAFESDELALLESLGELREIPPGIDPMPIGAILKAAKQLPLATDTRSHSLVLANQNPRPGKAAARS